VHLSAEDHQQTIRPKHYKFQAVSTAPRGPLDQRSEKKDDDKIDLKKGGRVS
jgi:hypothetical protein